MFVRRERSIKEFIRFYPVVTTIIIINLVLWLIMHLLHLHIGEVIYIWGIGHNISVLNGEYWRLLTPIFLHADFSHVMFNSFALVLFAPALEQMLGKLRFILFYLLTGLIGNIGTFVINKVSITPHLGASGAIYGLFGIYLFMVYFRKHLIDRANAQIITVIFFVGLIMSFIQPNINIAAHIFGFISGFLLGSLFLIGVERFSLAKNYTHYQKEDNVRFDPNRWQKRKVRIPAGWKSIIWFIFIILVMIGFISRYIHF